MAIVSADIAKDEELGMNGTQESPAESTHVGHEKSGGGATQSPLPGGIARGKAKGCDCQCKLRDLPPEVPDVLPYLPS